MNVEVDKEDWEALLGMLRNMETTGVIDEYFSDKKKAGRVKWVVSRLYSDRGVDVRSR